MAGSLDAAGGRASRASAGAADCADGELLRLFAESGRQAAFAELVRRHGPMVLGVCRRRLDSTQDAEDAFQVTFLVLAKKATSIKDPSLLGNWLYGVAYRVANKARLLNSRRQLMLNRLILMRTANSQSESADSELETRLDREIKRLPAKYRAAIVTCYLEGKSNREAARILGWPQGTLVTRLNRAKQMLRSRLGGEKRVTSASVLGGTLAGTANHAVHPALFVSTVKAGSAIFRGKGAASFLSDRAALLLKLASRGAMLAKAKIVTAIVLVCTIVGAGAFLVISRHAAADLVQPKSREKDQPSAVPAPAPEGSGIELPMLEIATGPGPLMRSTVREARDTTAAAAHASHGYVPKVTTR
jgi:RNA polymerase sigma factor (sigma-70 family)